MSHPLSRAACVLCVVLAAACASTTPTAVQHDEIASPQPEAVAVSGVAAEVNQMVPGKPGPGEEVQAVDLNGDGKPDEYNFYPKGTLGPDGQPKERADGTFPHPLRREIDLNGDGKIDMWQWFDRDGNLEREAYDLDFDGKVDLVVYYEKGVVIRKEVFHGFSDKPDEFKYYEGGKLVRVEYDRNHDGRIDEWDYYQDGKITRIGYDDTGDGNVDRWVKAKPEAQQ